MSYDKGELCTIGPVTVTLTGTSLTEAARFALPKEAVIEYVAAVVTTATTASEVTNVQIGSGSDPDAYGTLVLTDASINTVVDSEDAGWTGVSEGDNGSVRKGIDGGSEIVIAHFNDGALAAGIVEVTVVFRLQENVSTNTL